ncbi:MAG: putative iron-regulated protein [Sulfitobacter sp.]|jgi:uncharacterized iron-regulated protein
MKILFGLLGLLPLPLAAQQTSPAQISRIAGADIVILGEIHDNPLHHLGQAALIKALHPSAVVFEMLSPEQAALVNADTGTEIEALGVALDWAASGWPDFNIYAPVIDAAREHPVFGAAAPRDTVRAAFGDGAAAVFGTGAERFGLDLALPEGEQSRRAQMQFEAHCAAMPLEMMSGMIEAQRLRDAWFSDVALQAFAAYGAPVVVIAGNGHARRDWAMPHMINSAAPERTIVSVGFVETPETAPDPRFDITLPTDPAERPDPCDTFKKQ